uniref:solute carrier family 41 member 1-like n=1 Tax=Myxine glutinosa TaxID=7769 RepID=UPI00358F5137
MSLKKQYTCFAIFNFTSRGPLTPRSSRCRCSDHQMDPAAAVQGSGGLGSKNLPGPCSVCSDTNVEPNIPHDKSVDVRRRKGELHPCFEPKDTIPDEIGEKRYETSTGDEHIWTLAVQVAVPFFFAALGTAWAGIALERVQHWKVFRVITELFILVPPLLGLKGNLEMTLAARFSTAANIGTLDSWRATTRVAIANLSLIQLQATVVGFLAALLAMMFGYLGGSHWHWDKAQLVCTASILTAFISAFILGLVTIFVIVGALQLGINPDNVATPIAASLGDLVTLTLIAIVGSTLYTAHIEHLWLYLGIVWMLMTPLWVLGALSCPQTKQAFTSGWQPVIFAVGISSLSGLILDWAITGAKLHEMATYTPIINGIGGNLVAVQASRLSTGLHLLGTPGEPVLHRCHALCSPIDTFFGSGVNARSARLLLVLAVPGHLLCLSAVTLLQPKPANPDLLFILLFLGATLVQVFLLLWMADMLVHVIWRQGSDPDSAAIPYLTALGDLFGTALLTISFHLAQKY